jgi:hypothetical protein
MSSKIFKEKVPIDIIFNFLDRICLKTERYYQIDNNAYRKMIANNIHEEFLEIMKKYYNNAKQHYITRELTYNSFTNIIRQICKSNNIAYQSKISYNKSKYGIIYFIYYNNII